MRGKPVALLLSSTLLIVLVAGFALIVTKGHTIKDALTQAVGSAKPTPYAYDCYTNPGNASPLGSPAIKPRNNDAVAFTAQDARDFESHQPPSEVQSITIDDVHFTTSAQACLELHGVETGLAPNAMVCLVRFHGIGSASLGNKPFQGVNVFDAHTGNILVQG